MPKLKDRYQCQLCRYVWEEDSPLSAQPQQRRSARRKAALASSKRCPRCYSRNCEVIHPQKVR